MTASLPRIGIRPRAQRLLSRLAAALVVGSVAVGAALTTGASPASAATDEPTETGGAVTLALSTGSGATVAPGSSLLSSVALDNDTDAALSAGTVTIELSTTRLPDSASLDAWLDGGTSPGRFRAVATEATPAVDGGSTATTEVIVDAADLGALTPGVYPLRATLNGATSEGEEGEPVAQQASATTVLVVAPTGDHRTGVIVPITATPADGSLLTSDELSTLTAPDGALTGQLDAVTGTTALLAVDPAIPAAIRMLGTRAPAGAIAWLDRLENLPNDIFTLQFADADAATQAHAGQSTLLAPQELAPLLQPADFPLPEAPPTPTPTPTPGPTAAADPALPDNAALSAIRGAQGGILWPRGDLTDADIAHFGEQLGDGATIIVPSSSVNRPGVTRGTVGGQDVLVTDTPASARLSAAVEAADEGARQREIAAVAGHLFYAQQRSPLVLLGLERSETRSPIALRAALSAFASPDVRLLTALTAPAAPVTLTGTPDEGRAAAYEAMLQDEQRIETFSSILEAPAVLLVPERIRILRAIGVGLDDEEFAESRAARTERVSTTLRSVSIQQPQPVQLFTSAAPLPVWVRNDLPWPVTVTLSSTPSDPRLDIQPLTEVTALAASSTRVNVPIEARVASGDVRVAFRLIGPNDAPIGEPAVADVTLRADWESIGLVILGGVIVVLFVLGLARTIVRKRGAAAPS
ncbi:DUF6049 family protein [Microbacterium sp.]|uniref:DUF6049 family protein n=1 Tax=Microbacterium sp. TaxID=51671 RepID=UPI002811DFB2|nr:DUF6049 family protein [Microbacterium sp.]